MLVRCALISDTKALTTDCSCRVGPPWISLAFYYLPQILIQAKLFLNNICCVAAHITLLKEATLGYIIAMKRQGQTDRSSAMQPIMSVERVSFW